MSVKFWTISDRNTSLVFNVFNLIITAYRAHIECAAKEGIAPKLLDRIEVVLALHQQTKVGFHNVAVGDKPILLS